MNRTTHYLAIVVMLLLIPACASVTRQGDTGATRDPVREFAPSNAEAVVASAWKLLAEDDLDGSMQILGTITVSRGQDRAGSPDPAVAEAWRIKAWIHHLRGEWRLEAAAWRQSLFGDPSGDYAIVAWLKFVGIQAQIGDFTAIRNTGTTLLDSGALDRRLKPLVATMTAQAKANLGEHRAAEDVVDRLGFATAWSVIGPFDGVAGSGYHRVFGPERDIDPGHVHEDDWGVHHQWRRIEDLKRPWIDLASFYEETADEVFYALTNVTVSGQTEATLKLGLSGGAKVWLNGELVLASETERFVSLDLYEADVVLRSGENSVLIKVCGGREFTAGFAMRITDRDGASLSGLAWAPAPRSAADSYATTDAEFAVADEPVWKPYLRARARFLENGSLDDALALTYLADYGDAEGAFLREFLLLAERYGRPAVLLDLMADCYHATGRDDLVESTAEIIGQRLPEAEISVAHRFDRLMREGKYEEAYALTSARWRENKEALLFVRLAVQAVAVLGNRFELENLCEEWAQVTPDCVPLILLQAGEGGLITDPHEKVTFLRSKWERQRENEDLLGALLAAHMTALEPDEAIRLLEDRSQVKPHDPYLPATIALLATMTGDLRTGAKWASTAMALAPDDPAFKQVLGEILKEQGQYAEARRLFTEALRDQPDNWDLREAIWAIAPDQREPRGFLMEPTNELVSEDRESAAFPDAASYLVLQDVQRLILPDLASKVTYRLIGRVNDDQGVQEQTQRSLSLPAQCFHFEVDRVVTIKPDDRRIQGEVSGTGVSLTDLKPGDYFEVVYTCYVSATTFMGREVWQAHLLIGDLPQRLTRFQIMRPEDLTLHYANPAVAEARVEPVDEGMVRMTWSIENLDATDFETGLTSAALKPYLLDFSSVDDWSAVGAWYERQTYRQSKPSDRLAAFANELVAGVSSPREQALILARFVTSQIAYSEPQFQLAMVTPAEAEDVLERGIGDCKDQSVLLLALARAVGIEGSLALMHTNLGRDYPLLPGMRFNHVVARLDLPDGALWVDPTNSFHDPTVLPAHLQGAQVLLLEGAGSGLTRLPIDAVENARLAVRTDLSIDEEGEGFQRSTVSAAGRTAAWIRAVAAKLSHSERHQFIESSYSNGSNDLEITTVEMPAPGALGPEARFSFEARRQVTLLPLGMKLGLQAPFQTSIEDLRVPALRTRRTDLDLVNLRGEMSERVVVQLPTNLKVASLPEDVIIETPEATYRFTVHVEGDTVVFERCLTITAIEVPAGRCDAFADFLNQASRAERSMVVLDIGADVAVEEPVALAK